MGYENVFQILTNPLQFEKLFETKNSTSKKKRL